MISTCWAGINFDRQFPFLTLLRAVRQLRFTDWCGWSWNRRGGRVWGNYCRRWCWRFRRRRRCWCAVCVCRIDLDLACSSPFASLATLPLARFPLCLLTFSFLCPLLPRFFPPSDFGQKVTVVFWFAFLAEVLLRKLLSILGYLHALIMLPSFTIVAHDHYPVVIFVFFHITTYASYDCISIILRRWCCFSLLRRF